MSQIDQYLQDKLNERAQAGNLRTLAAHRAPVDFFSNDYLGLATTGILQRSVQQHAAQGTGATGSRLLSGNAPETEALEQRIAAFHHAEAALIFNSGYDANIGLISSVASRHTIILYDELCHASLIDGIRLSQCFGRHKFAHNNLEDLANLLHKHKDRPLLVVTESIFSMDGDMAPLTEITALCETYSAKLIVDEAHATGVIGPHGEGLVCSLGLQDKVFARVHTFGKALGTHGAAVVGSRLLRDYLINFARTFIYTTALPPHAITAISCAYDHLAAPTFNHQPLHDLIHYFRDCIAHSGMQGWKDSYTPIQAFIAGSNERAKALAYNLQKAGLQVNAILSPTVAVGEERLRVCLHGFNTREEVERVFEVCEYA